MKIDVFTYDDPRRWRYHTQYNNIKNAIHICATKNMLDGISEAYQDIEADEFTYMFTIRELIDELLIKWSSSENQLKQYLALSRVISEYNTENFDLKEAFRNNRTDILETIRFLTFTGVCPEDLSKIDIKKDELTDKEKLFQQIWFKLEEIDPTFKEIRNQLRKRWSTTEVKNTLNKLLSKKKITKNVNEVNKIILHGFYFITPEQQVFLQALGKAGFEIVFFNFYDQRYSDTFNFTRAFISKQFNWTDNWKIESNREIKRETLGSKFLSAFEDETSWYKINQEIISYDSFFEFLNAVIVPNYPIGKPQDERKDVQIIATNADILNDILVQYYPEKFAERRNFLQYPIGQFISKIHQMIDASNLILNEDILISAFSSGWLYNPLTKKNARDYSYLLKQLLPFFENCINVHEEWIPRFSELLDTYDNILPAFEELEDNSIVKIVRSPFTKIAHFSLTRKQVEEVHYFVEQLINIANELFDVKNKEASISEHFKKLQIILDERNPSNHFDLFPDEVDIIGKLNDKLKIIRDDNYFLYDDIGEAINFYLSGKLSHKDESFIKPFIEVDGEAFKQNITRFYLTGLDEKGLPLDEFSTPWPLQEVTFEKLSIRYDVLELNTLRNKSVKQISRYLLFIAFEFLIEKNMELSWMKNFLDRKNLQPAVYIHQLGMRIKDFKFEENCELNEIRPNPVDFNNFEIEINHKDLSDLEFKDFLIEYKQCPRRFYYSYILNKMPVFKEDFIHQFLYTDLIRLVRRSTSLDNPQVIEIVGELFPQWTDYKKEVIAETYIRSAGSKEVLEEISSSTKVSKARINFQFPGLKNKERDSLVEETKKDLSSLIEDLEEVIYKNTAIFSAVPGKHCRFCPHLDTCSEGEYPID
ncbi:hypothetical protein [Bacillus sp. UNCCL81]|uniref:hypothetical protein n=1 Tax=Bacillus sp. UNCCL81 TaxID=1502755 RepID=UPI0008E09D1B|nr:hypothetical protein [Bacillus sp. UNCCL81]SFC95195.1 hypothetical protein SAMN02799633_02116 [Bacillus sp. UNCCL81]